METLPLVSIPIITYNSSRFVVETLESIKIQTYPKIELVICDDSSTDDTVSICKQWVDNNGSRFECCKIITSECNTGVSANLNRAERECHGEWIKLLAGDDTLQPNAIESYVSHILKFPNHYFCFAKIQSFGYTSSSFNVNVFDYSFFNLTRERQLERLINHNCIPASTFFYKMSEMQRVGVVNDERIPMLEDWPKWINLLNNGVSFHFIDKVTVNYRLRDDSLTTGTPSLRSRQSDALLFIYYQFPFMFRNEPSRMLFMRLIYAHHFVGDQSLFWKTLWAITFFWKSKIRRRPDAETEYSW